MGALFNLCLYGALICLSLFLQQAQHESPISTGVLILPLSLAVGAGAARQRPADRTPRAAAADGHRAGAGRRGAALLATAGTGTSLGIVVTGSVILGLCSLAMPAMNAVVVGAAGPSTRAWRAAS